MRGRFVLQAYPFLCKYHLYADTFLKSLLLTKANNLELTNEIFLMGKDNTDAKIRQIASKIPF
jgi:hypothetical protein